MHEFKPGDRVVVDRPTRPELHGKAGRFLEHNADRLRIVLDEKVHGDRVWYLLPESVCPAPPGLVRHDCGEPEATPDIDRIADLAREALRTLDFPLTNPFDMIGRVKDARATLKLILDEANRP